MNVLPRETPPLERRKVADIKADIASAIADAERRLGINERESTRAAERLEVELRMASELPGLDIAAFADAQRQRLGALAHERTRIVEELRERRARMKDAFAGIER